MIKATGIWINKDKNGNEYFSGSMGSIRVVIMPNTFKTAGSKENDFNLYFEENKRKEDTKE